jgi:hypothetical protein
MARDKVVCDKDVSEAEPGDTESKTRITPHKEAGNKLHAQKMPSIGH